jgi:hypothetical protein
MQLTFRVLLSRFVTIASTGLQVGNSSQWTLFPQVIQADIAPLKDELYFMQSGATNIATHVYHFNANTDVNPKDRLYVLSSVRLAGPIGSWFEITERVEPTETLAFVRCYGRLTDCPPTITPPPAPAT